MYLAHCCVSQGSIQSIYLGLNCFFLKLKQQTTLLSKILMCKAGNIACDTLQADTADRVCMCVCTRGLPGDSVVKIHLPVQEIQESLFQSLGWEDPPE